MISREDLIEKVKESKPYLGADTDFPELFGKYGYTYTGVGDGWEWYEERLTTATMEELLCMLAITYEYWFDFYQKSFDESRKKSDKLDKFVGECERKYFGYDEDGYTEKTIDRVLEEVQSILSEQCVER